MISDEELKEKVLQHVGVKGMRWGIRKNRDSGAPDSDDHSRASSLKKKPLRTLTNAELQTLITRRNLERQYSEMNPTMLSKAKKMVADTLESVAREQVNAGVRSTLKYAAPYIAKGVGYLLRYTPPAPPKFG